VSEEVPQKLRESRLSQYKKSVQFHERNTLTLLVYADLCYGFIFGH